MEGCCLFLNVQSYNFRNAQRGFSGILRHYTAALCLTLPQPQNSSPPLVIHGNIPRGRSLKHTSHLAPGLSKKKLSSPDARTLPPLIRKQSVKSLLLTPSSRMPPKKPWQDLELFSILYPIRKTNIVQTQLIPIHI